MSTLEETYIDSFIAAGQQSMLSLKNFYDTMLTADIDNPTAISRVPIGDFFIKHKDQLSSAIQYYSVAERYFYQPKTLSLELYGTTELWLSLLRVNNMRNVTEFHLPIISIYNPTDLKELINIIFKREHKMT